MAVHITGVAPGSAAARAGIRGGETLLSINGHEIRDVLDYRFYLTEKKLAVRLRDENGAERTAHIAKSRYDDIGLAFASYLMDRQQHCSNKCVFCFIDQLPRGMRESLYFKDDDARLSFLFGNYITLTNLTDRDIERIIEMRISPVNISVHTVNPALRVQMMANPNAGSSLRYLKRLADADIRINTQLVLCPGLNDGAELEHSLRELGALYPQVQSIAAVPVGLTRYRDGLYPLQPFCRETARAVIDTIHAFADEMQRQYGERVAYPADEFFLLAGEPIPDARYYGEFAQLENGVGMLALLREEFEDALADEPPRAVERTVSVATGAAAYPHLKALAQAAQEKFPGLRVQVYRIENRFFGEQITVAGLITGRDLIDQLSGQPLGEALYISLSMLRREEDVFLDDLSVQQVQTALGVPVCPLKNDGAILLDAFLNR